VRLGGHLLALFLVRAVGGLGLGLHLRQFAAHLVKLTGQGLAAFCRSAAAWFARSRSARSSPARRSISVARLFAAARSARRASTWSALAALLGLVALCAHWRASWWA
jgi:hypothetical protein